MNSRLPEGFDPEYYLEVNGDVAASGMDPAEHYLRYGAQEGRKYRRPPERQVVFSTKHRSRIVDDPVPDIDADPLFREVFDRSREYSMTPKQRIYALYEACRYVARARVRGDFVECGVWRGGSSIAAALTFRSVEPDGRRRFFLYDTYEGMAPPSEVDVDVGGQPAQRYIDTYGDDGKWAYCSEAEVRRNFEVAGVRGTDLIFVKGKVEETIPNKVPESIALCRLDTDWYESTRHELEHLYPRLSPGGVLIIDDYGHWAGARKACDEFFARHPDALLVRVDEGGARLLVKPRT